MDTVEELVMHLGHADGGLEDNNNRQKLLALLRSEQGRWMAMHIVHLRDSLTKLLRDAGREGTLQ